jgi:hypothetical protein
MLKKTLFIFLVIGNQALAIAPSEEKAYQTAHFSPTQKKILQGFLGLGAIKIGIDFGKFTTSFLSPTKSPALKTALLVTIASIGAFIMAPTKDNIDLIEKHYYDWRHKE